MSLTLAVSNPVVEELEPPSSLDVDVRGLPPKRALLAKLIAWRKAIADELDILCSGRKDLADHITKLGHEKDKAEAEIGHTADNVLSRIKQGGLLCLKCLRCGGEARRMLTGALKI